MFRRGLRLGFPVPEPRHRRQAGQKRASIDPQPTAAGVGFCLPDPHMLCMTQWQKPVREPPKTKAQLREMLSEAVRNTAQPEPKRVPKAKRDQG